MRRIVFLFWSLCFQVIERCSAQLIQERSVNCIRDRMEVIFEFAQPFAGIVYTNKYYQSQECRWEGDGTSRLVVPIPLNANSGIRPYCGVQINEANGEYSAMLVISPMKGLLVDGMAGLVVRCIYNIGDITLTLPAGPHGAGIFISPQTQAGVVTGSGGNPILQMAIRDGHGITGEVIQSATVGQRITLDILMQDTAIYDFFVHDCYAHDGTNSPEASISVIDGNGCAVRLSRAVDVPVFVTPAIQNGAKHAYVHMYGFQFTTSQLVYFECQVRPCLEACAQKQCGTSRSKRDTPETGYDANTIPRLRKLSKRQNELQVINEHEKNYNLTTVLQILQQNLENVIPAARDAPIQTAGVSTKGEICVQTSIAIIILVIFVLVCIVSLIIAIYVCHRSHRDAKESATYYTPTSTPSHVMTAPPSPSTSRQRPSFFSNPAGPSGRDRR